MVTEHYLTTVPAVARPDTHLWFRDFHAPINEWVHITPDGTVYFDKELLTIDGAKRILYFYLLSKEGRPKINLLDSSFPIGTMALAGGDSWLRTWDGWVSAEGDGGELEVRLNDYTIVYEPEED